MFNFYMLLRSAGVKITHGPTITDTMCVALQHRPNKLYQQLSNFVTATVKCCKAMADRGLVDGGRAATCSPGPKPPTESRGDAWESIIQADSIILPVELLF